MSQRMDVCFSFLSPSERSLGWLFPTIFCSGWLPSLLFAQLVVNSNAQLQAEAGRNFRYYIWQIKRMVVYQ